MRFVCCGLGMVCLALGGLGVVMILGLHAYLPDAVLWAVAPILRAVLDVLAPLGLAAFPVAVGAVLLAGVVLLLGPARALAKLGGAALLVLFIAVPVAVGGAAAGWAWGDGLPAWAAWGLVPLGVPAAAPASWSGWALGLSVAVAVMGITLLVWLSPLLLAVAMTKLLPSGPAPAASETAPPLAAAPAKFWWGRRID